MSSRICDQCGKHDDNPGDVNVYDLAQETLILCYECAANMGFCLLCGEFFGGTEEFAISGSKGCCIDCQQMLNEESSYYIYGDSGMDFDPPY